MAVVLSLGLGPGVKGVGEGAASSTEFELPADPDGRVAASFSFRAVGLTVGRPFVCKCTNAGAVAEGKCWGEGYSVWASYNGEGWFHLADTRYEDGVLSWSHIPTSTQCFYASSPLYTREMELRLLGSLGGEASAVIRHTALAMDGLAEPLDSVGFSRNGGGAQRVTPSLQPGSAEATTPDGSPALGGSPTKSAAAALRKPAPKPPPRKRGKSPLPRPTRPEWNGGGGSSTPGKTPPAGPSLSVPSFDDEGEPRSRSGSFAERSRSDSISGADGLDKSFHSQQLVAFRAQLFKEEHLRSGTAKMAAVLRAEKEAEGKKRSRKVAKLEGDLASIDAKILGIKHQLRALCTDFWFGGSLVEQSKATGCLVPLVVESCVRSLLQVGLEEEGLFRVPGESDAVNELKGLFERAEDPLADADLADLKGNVHTIASCLKLYLRELEDPLLTYELYGLWVAIGADKVSEEAAKVRKVKDVMTHLPAAHLAVLRSMLGLFKMIVAKEAVNKMTARNLAVVFGPTFLKEEENREAEAEAMAQMLRDTPHANSLCEFLIVNSADILEDGGKASAAIAAASVSPISTGSRDQVSPITVVPSAAGVPKTWTESQYLDLTLSRGDAENLLSGIGVDGVFVVRGSHSSSDVLSPTSHRRSDSAVGFCVVCYARGATFNTRVQLYEGNLMVDEESFRDLASLVRHFQTNPLGFGQRLRYPVTRSAESEIRRYAAQGFTSLQIVDAIAGSRGRPLSTILKSDGGVSRRSSEVLVSPAPAHVVWVLARQRPDSTPAAWWMDGFLRRLADESDPGSLDLIAKCDVHVVPNVNPGGVRAGLSRTTQGGADITTSWTDAAAAKVKENAVCMAAMRAAPPSLVLLVEMDPESDTLHTRFICDPDAADSGAADAVDRLQKSLESVNPDYKTGASASADADEFGEASAGQWAMTKFSCPVVAVHVPMRTAQPGQWSPYRCAAAGRAAIDGLRAFATVAEETEA